MEETLGKRISSRRKAMGLTQDALAEQLGITAQAVSKWENDQSCPDITMLPRLAEIFHCTTDELLGLAAKESPIAEAASTNESANVTQQTKTTIHWNALISPGAAFGFWLFLTGLVFSVTKIRHMLCGIEDIAISCAIFSFGLYGFLHRFSLLRLGCAAAGGLFVLQLLLDTSLAGIDWAVPLGIAIALLGLDLLLDRLLGRNRNVPKCHRDPTYRKKKFDCEGNTFDCCTRFGEDRHLLTMPILSRGRGEVSFGELTLDLTGCQQFTEDCSLELHSSFGELTVLIPRTCRAEMNVQTAFAESSTFGSPDPDAASRIYVNGSASFGHIAFRYI